MRVCFFDIDGTLVATGGAGQQAFADVFRELWGIEKLAGNVSFAGRSDRAIAFDLLQAHGVPATIDTWHQFREAYIARLAQVLPNFDGHVLPGVEPLIAQLQSAGNVHVGLLTGNVVAGAEAKLSHYNLWQHFAFGGYGDEHTDRCDIASAALAAARHHAAPLNGAKERLAVIGDTVHDIRCARSIGAYAIAVPTGFTPMDELLAAEPDLAVETLEDCAELVDWLTND